MEKFATPLIYAVKSKMFDFCMFEVRFSNILKLIDQMYVDFQSRVCMTMIRSYSMHQFRYVYEFPNITYDCSAMTKIY